MVKKLNIEDDKSISSDDDSLMEKPKPHQKKTVGSVGQPKVKKPFVMTEARKKAFENARAIRIEMANQKKIIKEKEKEEHNKIKKILADKKEAKRKKREELELKVLETSSSEEDEPPPPKPAPKKKRKPKTPPPPPDTESESESEEEEVKPKPKSKSKKNVIIINNTVPKEEKQVIQAKPRPMGIFI